MEKAAVITMDSKPTIYDHGRKALEPLTIRGNPIARILGVLTPSFLIKSPPPAPNARPTAASASAWLDGLRGVAAISVLIYHFMFAFTDLAIYGYGAVDHNPMRLPFIHIVTGGAGSVSIFFVASGYVNSMSAMKYLQNCEYERMVRSLARSVFRRPFRLLMPVFTMTFMWTIACWLGVFEPMRFAYTKENKEWFFTGPYSETQLERFPTLLMQLRFWWSEMFMLTNPWNITPQYITHDPHLWSIAFELRSSMLVSFVLLATALCKPRWRLFFIVAAGITTLIWQRFEGILFFGGAAVAQLIVIQQAERAHLDPKDSPKAASSPRRNVVRVLCYITAMYFLAVPIKNLKKPGLFYGWTSSLIPALAPRKDKFLKNLAAVCLTYLLATSENKANTSHPSFIHRVLNMRLPQYMGKIMFGFYLVHGSVLHSVGYAVPHLVWRYISKESNLGWTIGLLIGLGVSFVISAWLADIWTREVDARIVKVMKWIESQVFEQG